MLTDVQIQQANHAYIDMLESGQIKKAADIGTDYIRRRVRESGFLGNLLTPQTVTNDELTRSETTEDLVKQVEIEADSPGAFTVGFQGRPSAFYIRGRIVNTPFSRNETRRAYKDTDELRGYKQDIRQIISDQQRLALEYKEDAVFLAKCMQALVGPNQTVPATGIVQWAAYDSAVTRGNVTEAMKMQTRAYNGIPPKTLLVNVNTAQDFGAMEHDEAGGSSSQELRVKGYTEREFNGCRVLVTNKLELVPDGAIWMFGDEDYLGKFFVAEEPKMYVKVDGHTVEFYTSELISILVENVAAFSRVDFLASRVALSVHEYA